MTLSKLKTWGVSSALCGVWVASLAATMITTIIYLLALVKWHLFDNYASLATSFVFGKLAVTFFTFDAIFLTAVFLLFAKRRAQ